MSLSHTAMEYYFTRRAKCYEVACSQTVRADACTIIHRLRWLPMRITFRHTMRCLSKCEPNTLLDIGCGCGLYSAELANQGWTVTAVDSCRAMIDATEGLIAQLGLRNQIQTVLADYLPWSRGIQHDFHLALAIGILDYIPNAAEWLRSFCRIARNVILTFPAKSPLSLAAHMNYRRYRIRGYSYTRRQIKDLLQEAELEIINMSTLFPGTYLVHSKCIR
jgi:2-polyprenyl-3-methyl-5-hydroxy-6-metoxy-1,4-benzoquinol methylase